MKRHIKKLCVVFLVFCVPQMLLLISLSSFSYKHDRKLDFITRKKDEWLRIDGGSRQAGPLHRQPGEKLDEEVLSPPPDTHFLKNATSINNRYIGQPDEIKLFVQKIKKKLNKQTIFHLSKEKIKILKTTPSFQKLEGALFNRTISSQSDSICVIPYHEIPDNICPLNIAWKCDMTPTFSHTNSNGTVHVTCDGEFRINIIDRTESENETEYRGYRRPVRWKYLTGPANVPFTTEYLDIACKGESFRERDHHNYHTQFLQKNQVNAKQGKRLRDQLQREHNWEPLSILVVTLDSLSRAHAHRSCGLPKTMELLRNFRSETSTHSAFLFNRFNAISSSTIHNLTPLFSGQLYENVDENKIRLRLYAKDITEWIWQYANNRGYMTSYGVDNNSGMMGTRTKCNDCHYRPPVVPHVEHGWSKRENEKVSPGVLSGFCDGDHFLHEHILNYTQQFLNQPHPAKWAALDLNAHHRPEAESINQVDKDLRRFLEDVLRNENLVVFLLGDHGKPFQKHAYNLGGVYETLLPFLSIITPTWLLNVRPDIHYNLLVNQQRYLVHRDLHLSMKSLLHFPNMEEVSGVIGETAVNVFTQEISRDRSCNDAGMPAWSCVCGTLKKLKKDEWRVRHSEITKLAIRHINQKHSKKSLLKTSRDKTACQGKSMCRGKSLWDPTKETTCLDITIDKILNVLVREEINGDGHISLFYHVTFQAIEYQTIWLVVVDDKWDIKLVEQLSHYQKYDQCWDRRVPLPFCVCNINEKQ